MSTYSSHLFVPLCEAKNLDVSIIDEINDSFVTTEMDRHVAECVSYWIINTRPDADQTLMEQVGKSGNLTTISDPNKNVRFYRVDSDDTVSYARRVREIIADKIASFRKLYAKYIDKSHSISDPGIANKLKAVASKILECIDWLAEQMEKLARPNVSSKTVGWVAAHVNKETGKIDKIQRFDA